VYIDPVGNIRDQPGSRRRRDLKKRERKNSISIYISLFILLFAAAENMPLGDIIWFELRSGYITHPPDFFPFFFHMDGIYHLPKKGQPGVVSRPKLICTIQLST
jgi:hypothetical protein